MVANVVFIFDGVMKHYLPEFVKFSGSRLNPGLALNPYPEV